MHYHEFFILTRPAGKHSVIDIWFSQLDFGGPRIDTFITPFYENICNLTSTSPSFIGSIEFIIMMFYDLIFLSLTTT